VRWPGDAATRYARDVVAGKVVVGELVRLACERHLRDLGEGPARGLRWDVELACHAMEFFPEFLCHYEGKFDGKPFVLDPFEQFIVGSLFGWLGGDGYRRFRTGYVEIGKGNGKSPLSAGVGLYGLIADEEAGAQIYCAATTRDQAGIAFRDAHAMAIASPALSAELEILTHTLNHRETASFLRPVSSEHRGLDGKRPHIALIDEIHEHPGPLVVDKMRAGTKNRRQALILEITNAGYDRESICWYHHEYSEKVLRGAIENDTWFAYVCQLDADDDWMGDEGCWPKANPGLGTILPVSYLREQVAEAEGMPAKQNIVARLNFCVWTEQAERWIDLDLWDENDLPTSLEELAGRRCFAGFDLSATTDLTALPLVFPPVEEGERWKVVPIFWCPEDRILERAKRDQVPYDAWARDGWIRPTEGDVVDYDVLRRDVNELGEVVEIVEIAIDRWNSTQLQTQLDGDGFTVVPFGQGFASMAGPAREFERLLRARSFAFGRSPVLRWNAANAAAKQDAAGNIKPDKARSSGRIDGVVGLVMAIGRAMLEPEEGEPAFTMHDLDEGG